MGADLDGGRRADCCGWWGDVSAPVFASTVGRVLERSARRTPDRLALTFGERRWSYAELDRAAGTGGRRVAVARAGAGRSGRGVRQELRRVPAALPWLRACRPDPCAGQLQRPRGARLSADPVRAGGCLRRSRPRRCSERGGGRTGRVQRGTCAMRRRARRPRWARTTRDRACRVRRPRRRPRATALHIRDDLAGEGRDAHAPGARARVRLVHRRARPGPGDVPLHALPLYHSAQMHVFLLPGLAVGATNHLVEAPDLDRFSSGSRARASPRCSSRRLCGSASPTTRSRRRRSDLCRRPTTARRSCPCRYSSGCGSACRASASTTASASRRSVRWPPCCGPRSTTAP